MTKTLFSKVNLRALALVIAFLIPVLSSILLANVFSASYSMFIALGLFLAMPTILSIQWQQFWRIAEQANLVILLAIVLLCSQILWVALLNANSIDASLQLFILLLSLLYAANLQLLKTLADAPETEQFMIDNVAKVLGGQSLVISFSVALIICNLLLLWLPTIPGIEFLVEKLLNRGIIPPITLTLFLWGCVLICAQWLTFYSDSLKFHSKQSQLSHSYQQFGKQQPKHFIEVIWQQFEAFFILPRFIIWAIPILGFIGTVLGISLATEGLSTILSSTSSEFSSLLGQALEPLGIAFDTTLIALSLSTILGLLNVLVYQSEEKKLVEFIEFNQIEFND